MVSRPSEGVDADVLPASAEHRRIETNGVTLHTVLAGSADGPPVVLLHGFPEFWYGWRHQIPALADAGYRVVIPDQRGYNTSDKPAGIDAYTVDTLALDAIGLLDALEYDSAPFVGHDWGAMVLWELLMRHPGRVERAVPMNVPHRYVLWANLRSNPRQVLRSSYALFFQLPRLPEAICSAGDWQVLRRGMDSSNRADTFTEADLDRYQEAWSKPGAFTAMLNWYRAALRGDVSDPPTVVVERPTMLVWGAQDPYLGREMAPQSVKYCTNGRLELIEDATHWVQHEVADRVNDLLLDFLGR